MEISIRQSNRYNQSMQAQQQPEKKEFLAKSMDLNQHQSGNQDTIKRKDTGDHLSVAEEKPIRMTEKANKILLKPSTELQISVHKKTKRINVKIINKESHEVMKEIPSERTLDMVAKMLEIAGLLVDEKV